MQILLTASNRKPNPNWPKQGICYLVKEALEGGVASGMNPLVK